MDLKANATLMHLQLASQIFSVNVELCRNGPYLHTYILRTFRLPPPSAVGKHRYVLYTDGGTFKQYVCTEYVQ